MEFIPTTDQGYDAWSCDYKGMNILLVNGQSVDLYVGGVRLVSKSGFFTVLSLTTDLPNGETLMVTIDGTHKSKRYVVTAVVGSRVPMQYGSVAIPEPKAIVKRQKQK